MLKAVYYHESKGRIQQKMKIDGQQFDVANLKPKEKGEFKRWLTPNLYQDGQIDITIDKQKGEYAVCAVLSIEEYEKDCDQTKGGGTQLETSAVALPTTFSLLQNAPNPMAGFTAINFAVAKPGNVSLKIYNISGQLVKTLVNEGKQPGYYNVRWDGKDESGQQAAAGVYFYRIQANEFNNTKKLVVLR
jgi:flagellar hook assembly protein FlgD